MPPIKIQHIVSCSSEDKVFKSDNLLNDKAYRKWKCAHPGEKQAAVVLQLEKSSVISSIDIGNEGSALIEVLVGKSSDNSKEFEVLLVTSSFMTPQESRQEINLNRVRMFDSSKLSETVAKEKWDRVKIVCSQPFNKNIQFGLSFVTLNSPENSNLSDTKNTFGFFKIKDQETEEQPVSVGSWLNRHRKSTETASPPEAGALAIRKAISNTSLSSKTTVDIKPKKLEFQLKKEVKSNKMESSPAVKLGTENEPMNISKKTNETQQKKRLADDENQGPTKMLKTEQVTSKNEIRKASSSLSKQKKTSCLLDRLMRKVIFALSGYQNPERGEIRDKAVAMGASYKPNWSKECTHLVCAFKNTPKYNQVKSQGGKIVSDRWITDCFKKKSLLPWKKYTLEKVNSSSSDIDSSDNESTDFDSDDSENYKKKTKKPAKKGNTNATNENRRAKQRTEVTKVSVEKENSFLKNFSDKSKKNNDPETQFLAKGHSSDDDSVYLDSTDVDETDIDTEEEILRVKNKIIKGNVESNDQDLPKLPDFFKTKTFYLYGTINDNSRKILIRYIIGCEGVISEYMNEKVSYILTESEWKKDFDEVIKENAVKILKPSWVFECIKQGKSVNPSQYMVRRK